ncbi:uncharacterized protein LOC115634832 [Scaptodrosophila lebanonensis]|uniref:Uncharacterized protein LOC115634832 n=1 Tax=Drosophila lebanonensis TaxID=7225 RepID=A0A6J2UK74_DROLE|nr:uncharacterized protein LOC115634832 [Scaptodrosophila lebanonensis]
MERSHSCSNFEASGGAAEQPKPHAGSSDNLPLSISSSSTQHFPPNKPLRRRKLQRQQSAVDVDDIDMDMDYAADLEEEAEDAIVMPRLPKHFYAPQHLHSQHPTLPNATALALQRHISCSSTSSSIYSSSSAPTRRCLRHEESFDSCSTAPEMSPLAQRQHHFSSLLLRDSSVQSDSSRYSSVDSLLESRKPDPEAILINLGFGPIGSEDILSRIPKRFLKPSQVRGIDTEAFVKRLQLASSLADSSVLGYRGLTGNPDMPPSSIVAKIMERFEVNQRKKSMDSIEQTMR